MSFNKIIIIGNLGRDPELRYTPQGSAVCSFSLATNEKRRDKSGEMQDVTTWFKITTWSKQAEIASKYLTKGKPVYIEGRLRVEEYTDRDGKSRFSLEVNATDMQFLSGGDMSNADGQSEKNSEHDYTASSSNDFQKTSNSAAAVAPADEDIPF